jgi:hypothetical protein
LTTRFLALRSIGRVGSDAGTWRHFGARNEEAHLTWTTPDKFVVGQPVTAGDVNELAVDFNAFLFQSCIFDEVNGALTGVGSGFSGIRGKSGEITNVTPSSGQVTITFAAAFPNNIWTAWISQIGTGGASAQWQVSNATASGFTITSRDVGTNTLTSIPVSFYWHALGA